MAIKTEFSKVVINEPTHHFFCYKCGKDLGESEEYSDGYFVNIGEYKQSIHIAGIGWYRFNANFCEKCREQFTGELVALLESKGFKKDGD